MQLSLFECSFKKKDQSPCGYLFSNGPSPWHYACVANHSFPHGSWYVNSGSSPPTVAPSARAEISWHVMRLHKIKRVRIKTRREASVLVFPKLFTNVYHRESNSRPDVFPSLWSASVRIAAFMNWVAQSHECCWTTYSTTHGSTIGTNYVCDVSFFLSFSLILGVFQQHRHSVKYTHTHAHAHTHTHTHKELLLRIQVCKSGLQYMYVFFL